MNLPNSAALPLRASSPWTRSFLFHLGIGQRAANFRLQPIDDRFGRGGGRHEAVPAGGDHVGKTLFAQGGRVGIDRAAFGRGHTPARATRRLWMCGKAVLIAVSVASIRPASSSV